MDDGPATAAERALGTCGASNRAIHAMVRRALLSRGVSGGTLLDVGCGRGDLRRALADAAFDYVGADVSRYPGYPDSLAFVPINLDRGGVALPDATANVVACVETIEHVENPRSLLRELVRLAKPGGWLLVTTPNQLSVSAKLALVVKNQFPAFQEAPGLYPAHITALLESDLVRMATECRLDEVCIEFSGSGRVPLSARHWPRPLRRPRGVIGRAFSDNVLLCARRPGEGSSRTP